MLSVPLDRSQQFCRQRLAFVGRTLDFAFSRRRGFSFEQLCAHFHLAVGNARNHAHWKVAIAVQPTQKLSLCLQTKQRFGIVYRVEESLCALVIGAYLKRNYPLTAGGQKHFACKYLGKKLPIFKTDFGVGWRKAQTFQSRVS